ncbi:MAG: YgjV family protein [Clostridiales bacterium]|nr:YgjV family protein [Clostridiales bacterium]
MREMIGQAFGIIAIFLGFVSYQVKTKQQILLAQAATCVCFCIHYFLLGAYTGLAMNGAALLRNAAYACWQKEGKADKRLPIFFAVLMGGLGIWAWDGWFSIFSVLGLILNSIGMAFTDPRMMRKSILVTSPMVIVYDVFVHSIGGVIYESVAIFSSVLGLWRTRQEKLTNEAKADTM